MKNHHSFCLKQSTKSFAVTFQWRQIFLLLIFIFFHTWLNAQSPTMQWAKQLGGMDVDYGTAIATDNNGNVYTAGVFQGIADVDPGSGVFILYSFGNEDAFITKSDALGNFIWGKRMGGPADDFILSISLDATGNVYCLGNFSDSASFAQDPMQANYTLFSNGEQDIFLSKLNSSGNLSWVKHIGGTGMDRGNSIQHDLSGNIYITGEFSGTVDFDPGAGSYTLTSFGDDDVFIEKLDVNGGFLWARNVGGLDHDGSNAITVDAAQQVYVTGIFNGSADFDPGPGNLILTSIGYTDCFILKLDASGNLVWVKRLGGSGGDNGKDIKTDQAGNVYTTGWFHLTADFDPGPGNYYLTAGQDGDMFFSKLDALGNFIWAKHIGSGGAQEVAMSMVLDAGNNIYATGIFQVPVDFDPGLGQYVLSTFGMSDAFLLKLDSNGVFVWANQIGGADFEIGYSIALDAAGNIYSTGQFWATADFDPGPQVYNLVPFSADAYIHKMVQCIPPEINCPQDIITYTSGACGANVNYSILSTGLAMITHRFSGVTSGSGPGDGSGSFFNAGMTRVDLKITDACMSDSCYFFIIVIDQEAPGIACPPDITLNTSPQQCAINYTPVVPLVYDNCSIASVSWIMTGATSGSSPLTGINFLSNQTFNKGITYIVYTVTDSTANATSCSFTVTVNDSIAPVLICPADVHINNTPGQCTGTTSLIPPLVSDNCLLSLGNALHFDGIDDQVTIAHDAIQNAFPLTLEAWIRTDDTNGASLINKSMEGSLNGWGLELSPALHAYYYSPFGAVSVNGNTILNDTAWHHVAVVFSASGAMLYVDGNLDASQSWLGMPSPSTTTQAVTLGARPGIMQPEVQAFNGQMDEVRIWNRARTLAEIRSERNMALSGQETGLISYYDFNVGMPGGNNAGLTTLPDKVLLSGIARNGILSNFALQGNTSNWLSGLGWGIPTNNAPPLYPLGITVVTWTVTDASGNTSYCNQQVIVHSPEIELTGNAIPISDGDMTPSLTDHTDFGEVSNTASLSHTFVIRNNGTSLLEIPAGGMSLSGPDSNRFVIGGITLPANILVDDSLSFTIQFEPQGLGTRNAILHIINSDCNESPYDFAIRGTGICIVTYGSSFHTACDSFLWNGQTYTASGIYTGTFMNAAGCDSVHTLHLTIGCHTLLNLKLFLQGYYASFGTMVPVLMNQGVSNDSLLTDSILIELRNPIPPYAAVASGTFILQSNGNAIATFPPINGNYYIMIRHRNTIETWSATPIAMTGIVNYNFTTAANQAYGSNQTEVEPGIWAFYSGDINQDENVDLLDLAIQEADISNFEFGYFATDLNGDANVDLLDIPILESNINAFVFATHP